ncbi:alkaline phosphatase family protein [Paenibacillus sp. YPG26]|uniref:alkaline phosphatase family protein n=1 Tax=Paenibacillus sp. YPG26 TaxID=2878915 RepID=UPI00203D052E|nr:alkaline phosphatase family protein [Paenibacillus sp. YPG26]USB31613.1 alkaline phosphatase family protein [Paenibacillus sp. YPG26]
MSKVIMIVLDGLKYETARASMGYLNHLVEVSKAACYKVRSELPSLSRPLYEVLLTGTPCSVNGITANHIVRLSHHKSVFHLAVEQGLKTAAAAYYWVSELYNRAPFDKIEDREQHHEELPIQHGKFYFDDAYPDSHLFIDAEVLRRQHDPDFLYIHPMGIDDTGHKFTSDSKEYRGKVLEADMILATFVPQWMSLGYEIIVTSDHGMNTDGHHGGTGIEEREVPFYAIGSAFTPGEYPDQLPQLAVAPLLCRMLSLPLPDAMSFVQVPGFKLNL